MTAESMVEKVARAIAHDIHKDGDWGLDGATAYEGRTAEFEAMARAAIEAMREPTRDMKWAHELPHIGPDEIEEMWRAMIDAALSEPSP
jgi:hypothetical protein